MKYKQIVVTLAVRHVEGGWFSECLELGTVSQGSTEQEALENIQDATLLYLNTLEDYGECEQVLRAKGVEVHPVTKAASVGPTIGPPKPRTALRPAVFTVACAATA